MLQLTDEQLKERLPKLVQHERKIMATVLEHVVEVDKRRLYLQWGYSSLFDYMTKELKYSESSAHRRISAARALHKVPEILTDVESGALNLSQITKTQASIRLEEQTTGEKIGTEKRREIFEAIRSMNGASTEKVLDEMLPNPEPTTPVTERHKRDDSVEVTLRISKEL